MATKPSAPSKKVASSVSRKKKNPSSASALSLVQKVTVGRSKPVSLPSFRTGDTVSVYVRVREGEKERLQLYQGVVIKIQGSGSGRSFTVRKVSSGVGVERTFPFRSPAIDRVELVSNGNVRRAKLLYLRDLKGRAANIEGDLALAVAPEPSATESSPTETAAENGNAAIPETETKA